MNKIIFLLNFFLIHFSFSQVLTFSHTSPYVFTGPSTSAILTVQNPSADIIAYDMTALSLAAPFSYTGGSYPGTSGTCASSLERSSNCTLDVSVGAFTGTVVPDDLDITYSYLDPNNDPGLVRSGLLRTELNATSCLIPGLNSAWVREYGDMDTSTSGSLRRGATSSTGWSNGVSWGARNGDLELEFTLSANVGNSPVMIGLDSTDPNGSYATMDYALYLLLRPGSYMYMYVYENGGYRGFFGSVAVGNTFSVRRTSGTVQYLRNGTVFYTSAVASAGPLVPDSSFYRSGFWSGFATFSGVSFCGSP